MALLCLEDIAEHAWGYLPSDMQTVATSLFCGRCGQIQDCIAASHCVNNVRPFHFLLGHCHANFEKTQSDIWPVRGEYHVLAYAE
jgi:hypothetical protein